jgi:nitrogen fixation protein NifQ
MTDSTFATHYATLRAAQWPPRDEAAAFDIHVLACVLATGMAERDANGIALSETIGLGTAEIIDILVSRFPLVPIGDYFLESMPVPALDMEEGILRDLLLAHRGSRKPVASWLASIIARRAMKADHLWQDLGLFERAELGRLLKDHFPALHAGNTTNMRWKKFFYRKLCEAEGFALCTAPSCSVCTDFTACFGAEDGMSRMAEARRTLELAA